MTLKPAREPLAPCIAVVGPANSGKTSLLHQLDERLSRAVDSFYVIKGNPDGTGRYLYRAPDLREQLKERVKGKWGSTTVEQICEWIYQGRKNLALALLDFGGLHDERTAAGNVRMLSACSHYLLVTRDDLTGASLWDQVCRAQGLIRVGHLRSLPFEGPAALLIADNEDTFEAAFQVGVPPGHTRNDTVMNSLVQRLAQLARPVAQLPYINLRRAWWTRDMLATVDGEAEKIAQLARRTGVVVIGGKPAPVWAYLAALKFALAANPAARVFFFDPKQPQSLVEIPDAPADNALFPREALRLGWRGDGGRSVLEIEIATGDKFLPATAAQNLNGAPAPGPMPSRNVGVSGALPLWVYGTYARWLVAAGAERLSSWDANTKEFVEIWG